MPPSDTHTVRKHPLPLENGHRPTHRRRTPEGFDVLAFNKRTGGRILKRSFVDYELLTNPGIGPARISIYEPAVV
jgi:hypothetical protein